MSIHCRYVPMDYPFLGSMPTSLFTILVMSIAVELIGPMFQSQRSSWHVQKKFHYTNEIFRYYTCHGVRVHLNQMTLTWLIPFSPNCRKNLSGNYHQQPQPYNNSSYFRNALYMLFSIRKMHENALHTYVYAGSWQII